jgi:biopolymer transport protein ExbD
MSAGQAPRAGDPISSINVTPLVDVVLVLLIVLMVTSNYLASKSIPLDLPKAATGDAVGKALFIAVEPGGGISIDGAPVDEIGLRSRVRAIRGADSEPRATIAAGGGTPYARVVHVIDLLRQEKVYRLAISIQPEEGR